MGFSHKMSPTHWVLLIDDAKLSNGFKLLNENKEIMYQFLSLVFITLENKMKHLFWAFLLNDSK
jgi:hypothetical protein